MYSVFWSSKTFLIALCEYRLNGGSKTQVLMDDYCNQGKADYSDMIVH